MICYYNWWWRSDDTETFLLKIIKKMKLLLVKLITRLVVFRSTEQVSFIIKKIFWKKNMIIYWNNSSFYFLQITYRICVHKPNDDLNPNSPCFVVKYLFFSGVKSYFSIQLHGNSQFYTAVLFILVRSPRVVIYVCFS